MNDNAHPKAMNVHKCGREATGLVQVQLRHYRFTLVAIMTVLVAWALSYVFDFDLFEQTLNILSKLKHFEGNASILILGVVAVGGAIDFIFRNVCENRERAGVEHKIRAEQVVDGAMEAILSVDENHKIIAFNKSAEVTFGYTKDEAIGQPLEMLLPKDVAHKHAKLVWQFGISDERAKWMGERNELCALRKNGETFPAEISISKQNTSAGMVFTAILNDVSKRRQAEKALYESEERFYAFLNYTPNNFHIKDLEGRYTLINRKTEELFGVSNEDIRGRKNADIFDSKVCQARDAIDELVIKTGEPVESEEEFLLDDGIHTYLTVKFPILGVGGEVVAVGSSGFEITERKRSEQELLQHRDHLEKMVEDRTAEVTSNAIQLEDALAREKEYNALQKKFVSLVSHEFRTPLTIIDGTAQRLIRRKDKVTPEEVETRAQKVRAAITRMIGLIDTTLYASRLDAGKIELKLVPCDIQCLIREVCERQLEISPSHAIDINIEDLPNEVVIDPRRIDQVFTNLLSNAVKYAPDSPHVIVTGWRDGGDMFVSVSDCGLGIPDEDLPNMFSRFFRASTAEGIMGSGIGLSVVKEFVEMHDGSITVDSMEGFGSVFTVRLPIRGEA